MGAHFQTTGEILTGKVESELKDTSNDASQKLLETFTAISGLSSALVPLESACKWKAQ